LAARLRLLLFDSAGGLCLFLRLPGGRRLLFDCGTAGPAAPLRFLREQGEVGPQRPLHSLQRPLQKPEATAWLAVLGLLRGLVLRPGGAWLHWRNIGGGGRGFALQARVGGPPATDGWDGSLLAQGLEGPEIPSQGGGPAPSQGQDTL
jgi:hypothetical protein